MVINTILIIALVVGIFLAFYALKRKDSVIATEKDNNTNGILMMLFGVYVYGMVIISFILYKDVLLPKSASEHGVSYDKLANWTWAVIFFVVFVTQGLLHFFAFKFRGVKGRKASFISHSNTLEFIWTGVPSAVLAVLIIFGMNIWADINYPDFDEDPLVVEVYGKQWSWDVRYAGKDNVLGNANVRFIAGANTMGIDETDPAAKDDKVVREIHLPKGRKVLFKFRAQDVLHSAYFPHFRAQMNCVPGMVTQFAFKPIVTTEEMRKDEKIIAKVKHINEIREAKNKTLGEDDQLDPYEFDYMLLCNKICGTNHYNMQMKVVVEEPAAFQAWLDSQKAFAAN